MAQRTVDSHIISEITHKESHLTHQPNPIKGGPTAQAQKHAGDTLSDGHIISDIAKAEEGITHHGGPVPGGPAAFVQSEIAHARNETRLNQPADKDVSKSGKVDSDVNSSTVRPESEPSNH